MAKDTFSIKTPAKINTFLKITGKRSDGYHDIVSIMVPVSLFDSIEINVTSNEGISIDSQGVKVAEDETNLVYRAADAFIRKANIRKGLTIGLYKHIPVGAGLGGGSSDAAATLLALNEIFSGPFTMSRLHDIAGELGADVPFFLYCRPSIASGIGEKLSPIEKWPSFWFVIVTPPINISTQWVYRQFKLKLTTIGYDYIHKISKSDPLSLFNLLENDLEQVTISRYPIIDKIKGRLMESGAEGVLMSGSGSSVFGVFTGKAKAEKAMKFISGLDLGKVFLSSVWVRG